MHVHVCALRARKKGAGMEASEWLQGYLKDGPKEVSEIREAARREGYTRLQLREAKALCVVRVTNGRSDSSKKRGATDRWYWQLTEESA